MEEKASRLVLGIDEAGRGPVIGPMIIVGYLIKESNIHKLVSLGVKDSKLLTQAQREKMQFQIQEIAEDYKLAVIPPHEIDAALEKEGTNLNWLEADKAIEIINELDPDAVIMDCPSPNTRKFKEYILERLKNENIPFLCVHHADRDYAVVGAASILAKCTREEEVKKIEKKVGQSIGSGYPSNPQCQRFLRENFEKYPELFRKSWITFKNHSQMKSQKKLHEF